jgi:hypothetical protein
VTEEILDAPQVGAAIEHVGGARVEKTVRRGAFVDADDDRRGVATAARLPDAVFVPGTGIVEDLFESIDVVICRSFPMHL